jgi:hypothetical protein
MKYANNKQHYRQQRLSAIKASYTPTCTELVQISFVGGDAFLFKSPAVVFQLAK